MPINKLISESGKYVGCSLLFGDWTICIVIARDQLNKVNTVGVR